MSDNVLDVLFDTGTLVHLYIGRWTANKKLKPEDVLLDGKVDNNAIYLGHKRLMPKDALQPFVRLEGSARNFLSRNSIRFPVGNAFFVRNQVLPTVLEGLTSRKAEWVSSLSSFVENYDGEKRKQ